MDDKNKEKKSKENSSPYLYEDERFKEAFDNWDKRYMELKNKN